MGVQMRRQRITARMPRQKIIHVVTGWDAELRCHGIGTGPHWVADSDETGPFDVIAA